MRTEHTRILLYSHDTVGIGHTRRNLLIARALHRALSPESILLVTGARISACFDAPHGMDFLTLPSLGKDPNGGYRTRSLGIALDDLTGLRTRTIEAAVEAYDPTLVVVDKVPLGAKRELLPALLRLRARGRAKLVLGLRDVLDDPRTVEAEWARDGSMAQVGDLYDSVWIYGDPNIYALSREVPFPEACRHLVRYTGYLNPLEEPAQTPDGDADDIDVPESPFAVCMVGGGEDGARVTESFLSSRLPKSMRGIVLTGPHMPREARERLVVLAAANSRVQVRRFTKDPSKLLSRAERVVSMGGYNSVCELLAHRKNALIVPRVHPRREQLIRARRLAQIGALDCLHPRHLGSAAVERWLRSPRDASAATDRVDMRGLTRVAEYAGNLLGANTVRPATHSIHDTTREVSTCV